MKEDVVTCCCAELISFLSSEANLTNINDLKIFARVVRTGNMSAAGRELGYSPAVISKRVGHLEERLGVRLLQRTTRRLTLTETGEGYYKRVVDILSLVDEAENYVSQSCTTPSGILRLSAPTIFGQLHIAPHLPAFLKAYPGIDLDIQLSDEYVDIIREGYDLAVRIGPQRETTMLVHEIAPNRSVICATPKYIETSGKPNTVAELDQFECICAGAQEQWRLTGPDGEEIYRVRGKIRTNSRAFTKQAVLAHHGIGLFSTCEVGSELDSGALQVILPDHEGSPDASVSAVFPSCDFVPEKAKVLVNFLTNIYRNEPDWGRRAGATPACSL